MNVTIIGAVMGSVASVVAAAAAAYRLAVESRRNGPVLSGPGFVRKERKRLTWVDRFAWKFGAVDRSEILPRSPARWFRETFHLDESEPVLAETATPPEVKAPPNKLLAQYPDPCAPNGRYLPEPEQQARNLIDLGRLPYCPYCEAYHRPTIFHDEYLRQKGHHQ